MLLIEQDVTFFPMNQEDIHDYKSDTYSNIKWLARMKLIFSKM